MPGCPLPEYSSVIRWTVQDVINWLSQNKLKESIPNFRLAGVDGNKLLNCTDGDLSGISCPEKEIKIIMNLKNQVNMPNRPFANAMRYTPSKGYTKPKVPSNTDSDDEGWGSDEFALLANGQKSLCDDSDPEEEPQPVKPERPRGRSALPPPIPNQTVPTGPGRKKLPPPAPKDDDDYQDDYMEPEPVAPAPRKAKPPPIQPSGPSEELYEDPDKTVQVQHVHGGPLPPIPGMTNKTKAPPQKFRQVPPPRKIDTRANSSGSEDAEFYEDLIEADKPPPVPMNVPKRTNKRPPTPTEEVYDDPDAEISVGSSMAPPVPRNIPKRQQPKPPPTTPDVQEDYEEPEPPRNIPPQLPRNIPPRLGAKGPAPPPDDQEVYEEPDIVPSPPAPTKPPKFGAGKKQPPPPPVQADMDQEVYEDPDIVPSPPPPTKPPKFGVGKKPKQPPPPPVQADMDQETYEEPDLVITTPSKPHPPRNVPKIGAVKKAPAKQPVMQQEVYEIPDIENNSDGDGDDYLDMNEGVPVTASRSPEPVESSGPHEPLVFSSPDHKVLKPPKQPPKQTKPFPRKQAAPPVEEENYEEPDAPAPRKPPPQRELPRPPVKAPAPRAGGYTQVEIKMAEGAAKPSFKPEAPAPPSSAAANENLEQQKWFYGDTNRDEIRQKLEEKKVNGMYVIRNSTKSPTEPYTLQIYYNTKAYNLSIRKRPDGKYAIGSNKADEKGFSTLLELINFFKQNFLVLSGGSQTKLLRSLPKW